MAVRKLARSWQFDFTLQGHGRHRMAGFRTKAEALEAERQLRSDLIAGRKRFSFTEAYKMYMSATDMKALGRDHWERCWRDIRPILGHLFIEEVDTLSMDRLKQSLPKRLAPSSRNHRFSLVRSILRFMWKRGLLASVPAFAAAIAREGGEAEASWSVLPDSTLLSDEQIYGAIQGGRFDGVLVTRLLSVEQNRSFTPPKRYHRPRTTFYQAGPAWGMRFGGYYGFYATTFTEVHRPGYFETSKTFRLETNLYSAATNDLVWTAQSETIDPESAQDLLASMTAAVAQELASEALIP